MNQFDGKGESQARKQVFPENYEYEIIRKDKAVFRIPKNTGFFFDENDCWVYVNGKRARIGITDLAQQSLYDIIYFNSPKVGTEILQFGEVGAIESAKAVFAVLSPVAGKVTVVNEALVTAPELMNQDPYEKGWIAEVDLADFETDRKSLFDLTEYLPIFQRKLEQFRSK